MLLAALLVGLMHAQVADVTKAKAAVVNEKLEWEELDKQEQVAACVLICKSPHVCLMVEPGAKEGCGVGAQDQCQSMYKFARRNQGLTLCRPSSLSLLTGS